MAQDALDAAHADAVPLGQFSLLCAGTAVCQQLADDLLAQSVDEPPASASRKRGSGAVVVELDMGDRLGSMGHYVPNIRVRVEAHKLQHLGNEPMALRLVLDHHAMAGWEFGSGSISDQGRLVSLLTLLRLMPYRSASLRCVVPIPLSRSSSRMTCSPSRSTSRHRLPACRGMTCSHGQPRHGRRAW